VLSDPRAAIMLPVPEAIRRLEAAQTARVAAKKQELQQAGVDLSKIPQAQLESGEGAVIDAEVRWLRLLSNLKSRGGAQRADALEKLLARIVGWRAEVAEASRLAPATVLADHLAKSIAYTQPQTVEALRQLGLRSSFVTSLSEVVRAACAELGLVGANGGAPAAGGGGTRDGGAGMVFSAGVWAPSTPWLHAKLPGSTKSTPAWVSSWERWSRGEHPEAIAMKQVNNKGQPKAPIKASTVVSHLLTALQCGKGVDMAKLAQFCASINDVPPTSAVWEQLEDAAGMASIDVVDSASYAKKDMLVQLVGNELATKEFQERTEAEKGIVSRWYSAMKWWDVLKRVHYTPHFANSAADGRASKVQRV
jgi:hypothetical protein